MLDVDVIWIWGSSGIAVLRQTSFEMKMESEKAPGSPRTSSREEYSHNFFYRASMQVWEHNDTTMW